MITGIDIVKEKLRIAAGLPLSFAQSDVRFRGHAFECRINAEDPKTFLPSPGKETTFSPSRRPGIRVDSHLYDGHTVPPLRFADRQDHQLWREPTDRPRQDAPGTDELVVEGIRTNTALHRDLVRDCAFQTGG